MKIPALIIGRFQPFHLGHLNLIRSIARDYSVVQIALGSAQAPASKDNPFSIEERKEMISLLLKERAIQSEIRPIPDAHTHEYWFQYIKEAFPAIHTVFTDKTQVRELFQKNGYKVREISYFNRNLYNGAEVRKRILAGENWESLVPRTIADYLRKLECRKRLAQLS